MHGSITHVHEVVTSLEGTALRAEKRGGQEHKNGRHCKCMLINVPAVTNCGRSRITQVVLHPSFESLHPELLSEIHDRLRSFEIQIRGRGSLKLKKNDLVPVLDGVQRTHSHVVSDAKAAKLEAMRANGFVWAKIGRNITLL